MSTPASLDTASKCYCFNCQQFKSVVVYLLAKKAGLLALTPNQLDAVSKCFCFNHEQFERVVVYLLNQIKGGTGTASSLDTASKCFCFNDAQFQRVAAYSLNQINGGTDTPASLNTASKCYCFNDDQFGSVVVYLLNQINGGVGTPASLDSASKCFCFNEGQFQRVVTYLLDQIGSVPPPWTPASEATLLGWWKADSLALADGNPISSWNDSSSNGFTMTQAGAARPTYKSNIKNSLPAVLFDSASAQFLTSSMPANSKPFTAAAVIMSNTFSVHDGTMLGSSADGDIQFYVSGTAQELRLDKQNLAIIVHSGGTFSNGNWYIVIVTYDGLGNFTTVKNGSSASGTNNQSFTGAGTTIMGARSGAASLWDGYIAEIMEFSSVIDISKINTYLNGKWSVY